MNFLVDQQTLNQQLFLIIDELFVIFQVRNVKYSLGPASQTFLYVMVN